MVSISIWFAPIEAGNARLDPSIVVASHFLFYLSRMGSDAIVTTGILWWGKKWFWSRGDTMAFPECIASNWIFICQGWLVMLLPLLEFCDWGKVVLEQRRYHGLPRMHCFQLDTVYSRINAPGALTFFKRGAFIWGHLSGILMNF